MSTRQTIEAEVQGNVLSQEANLGTVADYNLPHEFLRRVTDRVICESYFERFRAVIAEPGDFPPQVPPPAEPRTCADHPYAVTFAADTRPLPEGRPPLRAWRAGSDWPTHPSPEIHPLAARVNAALARDGLLSTTLFAMNELGPDRCGNGQEAELRASGIPTDLLACFGDGSESPTPAATISWLAKALKAAGHPVRARSAANKLKFRFQPAFAAFAPWADDGSQAPALIRLQLTRSRDIFGEGDGGSFDLLRQLVGRAPETDLVVQLQSRDLPNLVEALQRWNVPASRVRLIMQEQPLSQWAQDNLKPGAADGRAAAIQPRFASRGEEASIFMPGDDIAAAAVGGLGIETRRSMLLFQGGNLMVATSRDRERLLLVGESEIVRNTAIGLTPAQVESAFAAEFGADRVVVLPNASFHLDYELSLRAGGSAPVAFVADTLAAAQSIIHDCAGRLEGVVPGLDAETVRRGLERRDAKSLLAALHPAYEAGAIHGGFAYRFSKLLQLSEAHPGVAATQLLLKAIDLFVALCSDPPPGGTDGFSDAYFAAARHRENDRRSIRATLTKLGFAVCPVPSLSEGPISLNYLNGLQLPQSVWPPAYGGLFTTSDERSMRNFRSNTGGAIDITPLLSGESQRRQGAVRCSLSCFPVVRK